MSFKLSSEICGVWNGTDVLGECVPCSALRDVCIRTKLNTPASHNHVFAKLRDIYSSRELCFMFNYLTNKSSLHLLLQNNIFWTGVRRSVPMFCRPANFDENVGTKISLFTSYPSSPYYRNKQFTGQKVPSSKDHEVYQALRGTNRSLLTVKVKINCHWQAQPNGIMSVIVCWFSSTYKLTDQHTRVWTTGSC